MKERFSLTEIDFSRYPIWVRVQDYHRDWPSCREITEQTYQPWEGPLPLQPRSPFPLVLLAGAFQFSSGFSYPGYFQPVTEGWDAPLPPRKMRDGSFIESKHWSAEHGGTPLSILALHSPVVFVNGKSYDFHLRRDVESRKQCVLAFYAAIGKNPEEVFPIEFSADPALFKGVVSGRIDGFYAFPLNRPFEIERGERYLV